MSWVRVPSPAPFYLKSVVRKEPPCRHCEPHSQRWLCLPSRSQQEDAAVRPRLHPHPCRRQLLPLRLTCPRPRFHRLCPPRPQLHPRPLFTRQPHHTPQPPPIPPSHPTPHPRHIPRPPLPPRPHPVRAHPRHRARLCSPRWARPCPAHRGVSTAPVCGISGGWGWRPTIHGARGRLSGICVVASPTA